MRVSTGLAALAALLAIVPALAAPIPDEGQTLEARSLASIAAKVAEKAAAKVAPKIAGAVGKAVTKSSSGAGAGGLVSKAVSFIPKSSKSGTGEALKSISKLGGSKVTSTRATGKLAGVSGSARGGLTSHKTSAGLKPSVSRMSSSQKAASGIGKKSGAGKAPSAKYTKQTSSRVKDTSSRKLNTGKSSTERAARKGADRGRQTPGAVRHSSEQSSHKSPGQNSQRERNSNRKEASAAGRGRTTAGETRLRQTGSSREGKAVKSQGNRRLEQVGRVADRVSKVTNQFQGGFQPQGGFQQGGFQGGMGMGNGGMGYPMMERVVDPMVGGGMGGGMEVFYPPAPMEPLPGYY